MMYQLVLFLLFVTLNNFVICLAKNEVGSSSSWNSSGNIKSNSSQSSLFETDFTVKNATSPDTRKARPSTSIPFNSDSEPENYSPLLTSLMPVSLIRFVGLSDVAIRKTLMVTYGVLMGRPECIKQVVCIVGNYCTSVPYKDILFNVAHAALVKQLSQDMNLLFDIFRAAAMYGQDCQVYACDSQSMQPRNT